MAAAPAVAQNIVGLDLGQTDDFSALVVLEQQVHVATLAHAPVSRYACTHIQRWPIGSRYPDIVRETLALMSAPELGSDAVLVVDQTGVGRAVVDLFREQATCELRAVTITSGHSANVAAPGEYRVPKKDLVSVVQVLLGHRRFQIAAGMPLAGLLQKELQNFRLKITAAANETFGEWREGHHDDLVLAVAIAAWLAEKGLAGPLDTTLPEASRSEMSRLEEQEGLWHGGEGFSSGGAW